MNGYECDGTDIFIRGQIECSIHRGEAKLNRTFHVCLGLTSLLDI